MERKAEWPLLCALTIGRDVVWPEAAVPICGATSGKRTSGAACATATLGASRECLLVGEVTVRLSHGFVVMTRLCAFPLRP